MPIASACSLEEQMTYDQEMELHRSLKIPFETDLLSFPLIKHHQALLPYNLVQKHRILPLEKKEDGTVVIAVGDILNLHALQVAQYLLGNQVQELIVPKEAFEKAVEYCYHQTEVDSTPSEEGEEASSEEVDESIDLLDNRGGSPAVRLLNAHLSRALRMSASDIHFEPGEKEVVVRIRVDGVLKQLASMARDMYRRIITRVKVLAKMDIAEKRLPQDGRIKMRLGERAIDFRISTIPSAHGERLVLRILDRSGVSLSLSSLGMDREVEDCLSGMIQRPQGMILVTGPTGSGKTTTLYSCLHELNSESRNIMTIEDPIEYKLPGIAQIGVNTKIDLSFSKGLRHILRQDPDVIMIGEIRDHETAEIAIQASLTGHLVLSTLHTNDAPSAVTRLIDMGVEPYLLSSSILAVLAQRLVRRICPECKKHYTLSSEEKETFSFLQDKELEQLAQGEGCENCLGTGYRGRIGVYELMNCSSQIKQQMLVSGDSEAIKKVALEEGMKTLHQSALALAIRGQTTISEVIRVTKG